MIAGIKRDPNVSSIGSKWSAMSGTVLKKKVNLCLNRKYYLSIIFNALLTFPFSINKANFLDNSPMLFGVLMCCKRHCIVSSSNKSSSIFPLLHKSIFRFRCSARLLKKKAGHDMYSLESDIFKWRIVRLSIHQFCCLCYVIFCSCTCWKHE